MVYEIFVDLLNTLGVKYDSKKYASLALNNKYSARKESDAKKKTPTEMVACIGFPEEEKG